MYNSANYNEPNYNSTHFTLDVIESLSSTDQRLMMADSMRQEVATLVDAISKQLNNNPFLDAVLSTDDDIANAVDKALSDVLTSTDTICTATYKYLAEMITSSDIRTMILDRRWVDSMVLVDNLTKSISNKVLQESILLQSWISLKKTGSQWSN